MRYDIVLTINETKVITTPSGDIAEWRVNMRVSFIVE